MALIAFFRRDASAPIAADARAVEDDDLTWSQLWAIEMSERRWLWQINVGLVAWAIVRSLSS